MTFGTGLIFSFSLILNTADARCDQQLLHVREEPIGGAGEPLARWSLYNITLTGGSSVFTSNFQRGVDCIIPCLVYGDVRRRVCGNTIGAHGKRTFQKMICLR